MGLQPAQQPVPFNSGGVSQQAPVQQAAPVLQQNQVYNSTPFSNNQTNYTHQTVQQEVARLQAGGVGGLNQHPVTPTTVQQPVHYQNYYAPQPTFVQTQRRR